MRAEHWEVEVVSKSQEWTTTILSILDEVKRTYEYNYEEINLRDKETQDLLHDIEMGNHNTAKLVKLAKELQRARKERRLMKEENECLEPLYNFLGRPEWGKVKIDLYKIQTAIARTMEVQANRKYMPKVRRDLSICDKEAAEAFEKEHNG